MLSTRNLVTTELVGTTSFGTDFDDSTLLAGIANVVLTRIVLSYDKQLNSLAMHYNGDRAAVVRGAGTHTKSDVLLATGEFVTCIEGVAQETIISQLSFVTNRGVRFGPYGKGTGVPFVWNASDRVPIDLAPRMGLLYFAGRASANYVNRLSATFALYPEPKAPTSDMQFEKRVTTDLPAGQVALSSFARNLMSPVVTLHVGPDDVQFHASEATLCRLPFFRAALQGGFKEAAEKKITLPEDEPEVFSALLEYLYNGRYTVLHDDLTVCDLAQGCFHVRVYAVASKYGFQPLVEVALKNFLFTLSKLAGIDILRLWKAAYENGLTVGLCTDGGRLAGFQQSLSTVLRGLYETDGDEFQSTVLDVPTLAYDLMRLLVSDGRP